MIKRWLLAALCLMASPAALACTATIDYDSGLYGQSPHLNGVGWGSLDSERQNAAFSAMGIYRSTEGTNSLPANSTMCVTYDDNSTETFRVLCNTSPACLSSNGNHSPPAGAGGGGAAGYYRYSSIWIYFGQSGCIGCVYWGEVGEPVTPPPSTDPQ